MFPVRKFVSPWIVFWGFSENRAPQNLMVDVITFQVKMDMFSTEVAAVDWGIPHFWGTPKHHTAGYI